MTVLLSELVANCNSFLLGTFFDHLAHPSTRSRVAIAHRRQWAVDGEVVSSGNEQFLGREAGDHFVTLFRDHNLFFNAPCTPAVRRRPERFECKHHSWLDLAWMIKGDQAADDGFLPDRQTDPVSVLKGETGFFVRKTELLCFRPYRSNFGGGTSWPHKFDGSVEVFAAPLISI